MLKLPLWGRVFHENVVVTQLVIELSSFHET